MVANSLDGRLQKRNVVSSKDIGKIVKIAQRLHPIHEKLNELSSIFDRWHKRNGDIFKFISITLPSAGGGRRMPRKVGYTCVIPLTRKAYLKYEKASLSEWDIGLELDDIESPSNNRPCRYILIQSIELEVEYRNQAAVGAEVLRTLVQHLAVFNPIPHIEKPILIADGNEIGARMLSKRGFHKIVDATQTIDPRPLFRLDFSERNPSAQHRKTTEAITNAILGHDSSSELFSPLFTVERAQKKIQWLPKIFICYSHADASQVNQLAADLRELGHDSWFDAGLAGGQNWWSEIMIKIKDCNIFIFAISDNALTSDVCRKELHYARSLDRIILPIRVASESENLVLPEYLAAIQQLDYRAQDRRALASLSRAIHQLQYA